MQDNRQEGRDMLRVSSDDLTKAIQKDLNRAMEEEGVANFFEYGAEKLCISPNTFRNLIENGNWHKDHFEMMMKHTKAYYLKQVFKQWSE